MISVPDSFYHGKYNINQYREILIQDVFYQRKLEAKNQPLNIHILINS